MSLEYEVFDLAEFLWWSDPFHHAQCELTAQIVDRQTKLRTGVNLTEAEFSLASWAASIGIVVAKRGEEILSPEP